MPTGPEASPLGPYDRFEVLSALRKSIKLDDPEAAIYWLHVLLEHGGPSAQRTAARQLWIVAAEDVDDPAVVLRAFAVFQMVGKVPEPDHLFFLVAQMCSARKWWEHPDGHLVDHWWAKAVGALRSAPRQVPSHALDRHTRRGWQQLRAGLGFDDRFSGSDVGRAKTLWLFTRWGRLDSAYQVDAEQFRVFWQERRDLQASGPRDVDEPDEWPRPPCLVDPAEAGR